MNKQVSVFNETIMNIFENFIPHETITCNDKDPPWMNRQTKTLIEEKDSLLNLMLCKLNYKVQSKSQKNYLIHP